MALKLRSQGAKTWRGRITRRGPAVYRVRRIAKRPPAKPVRSPKNPVKVICVCKGEYYSPELVLRFNKFLKQNKIRSVQARSIAFHRYYPGRLKEQNIDIVFYLLFPREVAEIKKIVGEKPVINLAAFYISPEEKTFRKMLAEIHRHFRIEE